MQTNSPPVLFEMISIPYEVFSTSEVINHEIGLHKNVVHLICKGCNVHYIQCILEPRCLFFTPTSHDHRHIHYVAYLYINCMSKQTMKNTIKHMHEHPLPNIAISRQWHARQLQWLFSHS